MAAMGTNAREAGRGAAPAEAPPGASARTATRPAPPARAHALLLALLVAATFYYVPAFFFAQDDFGWLYLAKHEWRDTRSLLLGHHGSFTPLANAYFRAMYAAAGLDPRPHHAAHLAMHLAVACLVLRLARRTIGDGGFGAFAAAAFFATTFSHWEAVMWLSGGSNQVMSTGFVLATVLAFDALLETGRRSFAVLTVLAFALGLLTKETAVTTPLLLVLSAALMGRRGPVGADAGGSARGATLENRGRSVPAGTVVAVGVIWVGYLLYQALGNRFARLIEGGLYPAGAGWHLGTNALRYLFSLALPDPRAPIVSGHLESLSPALARALAAAASISVWLLPAVIAVLLWRGGRTVRFGVLWILATLLPFLPLTLEPAARYLYLPSVGAALLVGCAAAWMARRAGRRVAVAALAALLAVNWTANRLAGQTRLRNGEARREIVERVVGELAARPEVSDVLLVGVPARYADGCDGVRLFADRGVSCTLAAAAAAAHGAGEATLVWEYALRAPRSR
jgi:hypothetical protein